MEKKSQCRICRRAGKKLFLKGEKCNSQKCPLIKKPYPPGNKKKRRIGGFSEYAKELQEKQKLKNWYGLNEKQLKRYVQEVLEKSRKGSAKIQDATEALVQRLELRLDNVVYQMGIARSRRSARQIVSHGHFSVNSRAVDIPSYSLKKGDKISVKANSIQKPFFKDLSAKIKKYQPPAWLKLNLENLEAEIIGMPSVEIAALPSDITSVFEFYSK